MLAYVRGDGLLLVVASSINCCEKTLKSTVLHKQISAKVYYEVKIYQLQSFESHHLNALSIVYLLYIYSTTS